MRLKSTGLGRIELISDFTGLTRDEEHRDRLVFGMKSTDPVRWTMSATIERRDVACVAWLLIKGWYWVIPFFLMLPFRRAKAEEAKAEAGLSAEEVARQVAKGMAGAGKEESSES
jgi:hypothetical protein